MAVARGQHGPRDQLHRERARAADRPERLHERRVAHGLQLDRVARLLEHRELTGDVEVVRVRAETGVDHLPRGVRERAGAVQHYHYIFECLFDLLRIVQIKNPAFNT